MATRYLLSICSASTVVMLTGILACKEEITAPSRYVDPPIADMNALLPLYPRNEWVYVDSAGNEANVIVKRVNGYLLRDNVGWWDLSVTGFESWLYRVQNDSVIAEPPGGPDPYLEYIPPATEPNVATFLRRFPFGSVIDTVSVFQTVESLSFAENTFDSLIVYRGVNGISGRDVRYFKRGIGLVRLEYYYMDNLSWSSTLIYHRLIK